MANTWTDGDIILYLPEGNIIIRSGGKWNTYNTKMEKIAIVNNDEDVDRALTIPSDTYKIIQQAVEPVPPLPTERSVIKVVLSSGSTDVFIGPDRDGDWAYLDSNGDVDYIHIEEIGSWELIYRIDSE